MNARSEITTDDEIKWLILMKGRCSGYDFSSWLYQTQTLPNTDSKGAEAGVLKEVVPDREDYIEHLFVVSTHHTFNFLPKKAVVSGYRFIYIPEGDHNSNRGKI